MDLNEPSVNFGLSRGLKLYKGRFDTLSLSENSFDLITLVHTLEHLPDPVASLNKIHRLLKNNGLFFVVVPNFGSVTYKSILRNSSLFSIPGTHIWFFTKKTLTRACQRQGFSAIKVCTCLPSMYLPIERNALRFAAKFIFRRLVGLFDDGSTIMAVFKKTGDGIDFNKGKH
jgi:ubiquinone/menaquinone biosynthesis C-methylase UbiE